MSQISKEALKLYELEGDWDESIFTCHNPTSSDVYIDLFSPVLAYQTNVPNTPQGYVQPPPLENYTSGNPIPAAPVCNNFPDTPTTVSYVGDKNFTFNFDSSVNRLFMTYFTGANWRLTFQSVAVPLFASNIAFPALGVGEQVSDAAVSTTSSKIIVITNHGRVFIINTATFAPITNFNLTTASALTTHNRVQWNSVNNTWYISANTTATLGSDRIIVVDAVTNAQTTTITTPASSNPFGLSFVAATNQMLVTYATSNQIALVNCGTNTISTLISNTISSNPQAIFYNSVSNLVVYGTSTVVRAFDFNSLVFSSTTIPQANPQDIGYYPTTNKLFIIPNQTNTTVYVVNGTNLNVDTIINISNGSGERARIAHYPITNQMFMNYGFPIGGGGQYYRFTQTCSPVFYIDGSSQYNYTVRDFFNAPAWVRRIYVYSKTEENLRQVITHLYKDANGVECQMPRIPILSVGVNQFQNWIAEIDFPNKECVFGINQWFQNVFVKANSELGFLLIYKQIDKSELLSIASVYGSRTLCDVYNSCPNTVRMWSEFDLAVNDYTQESEFKQNMFEGQDAPAVVPFDFSILKMYSGVDYEKRRNVENQV